MHYDSMIQGLLKRAEDIKRSQDQLEEESLSAQSRLDAFLDTMDTVHKRLIRLESQKGDTQLRSKSEQPSLSQEDFKALLEKLLQGSLDGIGDKISQRILDKLNDLKGLTGASREAKIQEIKQAADAEMVDLSKLFGEKIESNIEDIGVEEKETKGISKSLERLRKMKGNRKIDDTGPEEKKE